MAEDESTGAIHLRLEGHVTADGVKAAVGAIVERMLPRPGRTDVVADLSRVTGFDPTAPVIAAQAARPAMGRFGHVEIIAKSPVIRIAATSVAQLLRLEHTVRAPDED